VKLLSFLYQNRMHAGLLTAQGVAPIEEINARHGTRGITRLTPDRMHKPSLRVRAEVLDKTDILACVHGTSNLLLLHTDLMGTLGTNSISPGVEQTAYGVFIDLVDVLRAVKS
jgi:homoserine dehydrogenase